MNDFQEMWYGIMIWTLKRSLTLFGLMAMLSQASCASLMDKDEVSQSQLQAQAVHVDPEVLAGQCPLVDRGIVNAVALPPIVEGNGCGHPEPYEVTAFGGQAGVRLSVPAKLNCVMISQLYRYFADDVQPLAETYFGERVAEARVAASYACRSRNSKRGAKLSEHARMNAIDISAVRLASGKEMTIKDDWGSLKRKGRFLRAINRSACRYFTTVIGPDGDVYHQDHLHLDHGLHGRNGTWRLCQ